MTGINEWIIDACDSTDETPSFAYIEFYCPKCKAGFGLEQGQYCPMCGTRLMGYKVVKNTKAMCYQIIFNEEPETEICGLLKSYGFKQMPSQWIWQRQITENGLIAVKYVIRALQKLQENNAV